MNINKTRVSLSILTAMSVYSGVSMASGFAIIEQSVSGLGRSFAGGAAVANDASTIFFNPAGMTYLKTPELDLGTTYISPKANFNDNGSVTAGSQPLTGGDGGDATNDAFVPNIYYTHPLNDKVTVGLGINAPFGLVTDYNNTWKGRYHAVTSDLRTVNINPSLAFKATDKLSLGFGVDLQRISLVLSQMADLGARLAPAYSQLADGTAKITAQDWSWGYNLGMTYQATPATRLGLAYRSKISHTLEGRGRLTDASGVLQAKDNVYGSITLPETLSLAINHEINSQWTVMADATWTRWSRFQQLTIKSDNPSSPFATTKDEKWRNTMRYGLGVSYAYNNKWTFRSGVAYDETPVDSAHRTARIPDNSRKWVSIGASYRASKNLIWDAGYAHLFASDAQINEKDSHGYLLKGSYDVSIDLVGVQMRWQFQ